MSRLTASQSKTDPAHHHGATAEMTGGETARRHGAPRLAMALLDDQIETATCSAAASTMAQPHREDHEADQTRD